MAAPDPAPSAAPPIVPHAAVRSDAPSSRPITGVFQFVRVVSIETSFLLSVLTETGQVSFPFRGIDPGFGSACISSLRLERDASQCRPRDTTTYRSVNVCLGTVQSRWERSEDRARPRGGSAVIQRGRARKLARGFAVEQHPAQDLARRRLRDLV